MCTSTAIILFKSGQYATVSIYHSKLSRWSQIIHNLYRNDNHRDSFSLIFVTVVGVQLLGAPDLANTPAAPQSKLRKLSTRACSACFVLVMTENCKSTGISVEPSYVFSIRSLRHKKKCDQKATLEYVRVFRRFCRLRLRDLEECSSVHSCPDRGMRDRGLHQDEQPELPLHPVEMLQGT